MGKLSRSRAVVELGKKLAEQLDDDHHDLLAQWMAHDIAALIEAAKTGVRADRKACAEGILELWRHRTSIPSALRPLRKMETVLRVLNTLDPEGEEHRYYRGALNAVENLEAPEEVRKWLRLAVDLDYTARLLIGEALRMGARTAAEDAAPWIKLAETAGASDVVELHVLTFVEGEEPKDDEASSDKLIRDRIQRLSAFVALAEGVIEDLSRRLSKPGLQEGD